MGNWFLGKGQKEDRYGVYEEALTAVGSGVPFL